MLINCKECGREISDTAKHCPHCGAKLKREKQKKEKKLPFVFCLNKVKTDKKAKISLISAIASCAIVVCFLIMTIIAYVSPWSFLPNRVRESCSLANNMEWQYKVKDTTYRFRVGKSFAAVDNADIRVTVYNMDSEQDILGNYQSLGMVSYYFHKNGNIKIGFHGFIAGRNLDFIYNVNKNEMIPTDETAFESFGAHNISYDEASLLEIEYAEAMIDLVKSALNLRLFEITRQYSFDDILSDYFNYRDSLHAIRISSVVLMSIFTAVSACGIVLCIKCLAKKNLNNRKKQMQTI